MYLETFTNYHKHFEPTFFHAYIVNVVRLFFICFWYTLMQHILKAMNYFINLDMDLVEWVWFVLSWLLFILWTIFHVN